MIKRKKCRKKSGLWILSQNAKQFIKVNNIRFYAEEEKEIQISDEVVLRSDAYCYIIVNDEYTVANYITQKRGQEVIKEIASAVVDNANKTQIVFKMPLV